uniref:Uncharacterized protein n=1 Tax=Aegilops tauschii subsp. strangulata TaxID=200361 RepID=A0A453K9A0_AEGTS
PRSPAPHSRTTQSPRARPASSHGRLLRAGGHGRAPQAVAAAGDFCRYWHRRRRPAIRRRRRGRRGAPHRHPR